MTKTILFSYLKTFCINFTFIFGSFTLFVVHISFFLFFKGKGIFAMIKWAVMLPLYFISSITIPDCRKEAWAKSYILTFLMAIVWISAYSYMMVWMITVIGFTLGKITLGCKILWTIASLWGKTTQYTGSAGGAGGKPHLIRFWKSAQLVSGTLCLKCILAHPLSIFLQVFWHTPFSSTPPISRVVLPHKEAIVERILHPSVHFSLNSRISKNARHFKGNVCLVDLMDKVRLAT